MTEVDVLIGLIEEVSGNVVPERDRARLQSITLARALEVGCADLKCYIELLQRDHDGAEWRALLSQITINESYLFRAPQQFDALATTVIPDLVNRRQSRCLRLWSAGCARGEEAATLAVVLSESPLLAGWDWSILATDVDEDALAQARRGRYGARAVAKVPSDLLERYFEPRGDLFELKPGLRRRIDYRSVNLVREPLQVPTSCFDLIFFRNVLIYFRPSSQQRVATAVAATMVDDGYLFLGTSESLWQLCPELEAVDLGSCFCYRRSATDRDRETQERGRPEAAKPAPRRPPVKATVRPRPATAAAVDSSVQSLPASPEVTRRSTHLMLVQRLVEQDLEGALGEVQEALRRHPEDAVIRAFEGLCHDLAERRDAAVKAYRAALYLDPRLFQVRLLLARCLARAGMAERARHEHREVTALLASSEATRLPGSAELGLPSEAQARTLTRQPDSEAGR